MYNNAVCIYEETFPTTIAQTKQLLSANEKPKGIYRDRQVGNFYLLRPFPAWRSHE